MLSNSIVSHSLPANLVVDVLPAVISWVKENGKDTEDCTVGDKVEGHVRSNAGSKRSDRATHKGWREYIAASGRLYYHHKTSNTTQWKKPF